MLQEQDLRIQVQCETEYHGPKHGGWTICPSPPCGLNGLSIVYSLGVGDEIEFDNSVIQKYGLSVFAFDPTPWAVQWVNSQQISDRFHFYPFGISGSDGNTFLFPPSKENRRSYSVIQREPAAGKGQPVMVEMRKLSSVMKMLGHPPNISILKIDIEGAEYDVIDDMIANKIRPVQLLLEFHHHIPPVTFEKTLAYIEKLNDYGYGIFWMSRKKKEFSFIIA